MATRKFDGKKYTRYEHTAPIDSKTKARKAADDYRETGDKIRVVKEKGKYRLYGR